MFGGVTFGGSPFAGILSFTTSPPIPPAPTAGPKKGYPFAGGGGGESVPFVAGGRRDSNRLLRQLEQIEAEKKLTADEEDMIAILSLWLALK